MRILADHKEVMEALRVGLVCREKLARANVSFSLRSQGPRRDRLQSSPVNERWTQEPDLGHR